MKRALYTYEKNPVYKYKEPCVLFWKEPYYTSLGLFAQATVTIWIIESPIPPATTHMHTYTCGKSPVFTWKEPCIHMKTALCTYENSPVHIYKKKPAIPLRGRSNWQQWRSLRSSRRSLLSWPTHTRPTCMWKEPYIHMKRALCTYKNSHVYIQKQPCHTSSGPLTLTTVTVLIIESSIPPTMTHMPAEAVEIGMRYRPWYSLRYGRNIYAEYVKRDGKRLIDPHACRGGGDGNAIPPLVQTAVGWKYAKRIHTERDGSDGNATPPLVQTAVCKKCAKRRIHTERDGSDGNAIPV